MLGGRGYRGRGRGRGMVGGMVRGLGTGRGYRDRGRVSLHQHRRHGRLGRLQLLVGLLARAHHPREDAEGVDVGRGGDDRRVGEELRCLCAVRRLDQACDVRSRPAGGASVARVC